MVDTVTEKIGCKTVRTSNLTENPSIRVTVAAGTQTKIRDSSFSVDFIGCGDGV